MPQTRRRFIFVAGKDGALEHFRFPSPKEETPIKDFLFELAQDDHLQLPNHDPRWGFKSRVHIETGAVKPVREAAVPVRLSRTASEGNPIRDFNSPFPAVDTATVWGWARGNVQAFRVKKDRKNAMFVRNPESTAKLWRISAGQIRPFTAKEYARLQTFPDDWVFCGGNKRELQLQIGNAVPVVFAKRIAACVRNALEASDGRRASAGKEGLQLRLFQDDWSQAAD